MATSEDTLAPAPEGTRFAGIGRRLATLATAVAAGYLAWRLAPLDAADPFTLLLAWAPPLALGFSEVARWAERRGVAARATPAEIALLAFLALACLGRGHLGLRYPGSVVDPLLAAGLAGALAVRTWRLVGALREAVGEQLPRRPPWVFFALPLLVYLAILPWSTARRPPDGDEPWYLLVAHSLAYDFDARLTDNYERGDSLAFVPRRLGPQTGDPVGQDGELYSRHNVMLPLLLAPAYRLAGKLGALAVMAALAAALSWKTLQLASAAGGYGARAALTVWAILAFSPPLLLYSHQVWVEVPAALLVLVFLERLERLRRGAVHRRADWIVLVAALLALPLLKTRFVPIAGMLLLLALPRVEAATRRRLLRLAAGLAGLAVTAMAVNLAFFGKAFKYYDARIFRLLLVAPAQTARGLLGALSDPAFGLLGVAPIWLLIVPALAWAARREHRWLAWNLAVFAPYAWLVGSLRQWFGGWSPPFRYGLVALPVLALTLLPLFDAKRRGGARLLVGALATATAVLTLLWLVHPGWTYSLADGRGHLVDRLTVALGVDMGRVLPSYVRLNRAALVWPPLAAAAALALWWWPRRWPHAAAWGVVLVLATAAALPLAADRCPTRVLEFEDPIVVHRGGTLYPDRWRQDRPYFRGGWRMLAGDSLSAPVRPGGPLLDLEIELRSAHRSDRPVVLELGAGDRSLGRFELEGPKWSTLAVDGLRWPAGEPLVISIEGGSPAQVLLDRAHLAWRAD